MYGKEYLKWKEFKESQKDPEEYWYMGNSWIKGETILKGVPVGIIYSTSVTSGPYSDRFMHSPIPDRY